jgi:hypothetical protein
MEDGGGIDSEVRRVDILDIEGDEDGSLDGTGCTSISSWIGRLRLRRLVGLVFIDARAAAAALRLGRVEGV